MCHCCNYNRPSTKQYKFLLHLFSHEKQWGDTHFFFPINTVHDDGQDQNLAWVHGVFQKITVGSTNTKQVLTRESPLFSFHIWLHSASWSLLENRTYRLNTKKDQMFHKKVIESCCDTLYNFMEGTLISTFFKFLLSQAEPHAGAVWHSLSRVQKCPNQTGLW